MIPLLSREEPALRMLGLRLLAICLRRDPALGSLGSGSGSGSGVPASVDAAAMEGLWATAGDALATFPLTPPTREALLLLACAGSPSGRCGPAFSPIRTWGVGTESVCAPCFCDALAHCLRDPI